MIPDLLVVILVLCLHRLLEEVKSHILSKDGAFDDVVKDVEGVAHVASLVFFDTNDPQGMRPIN